MLQRAGRYDRMLPQRPFIDHRPPPPLQPPPQAAAVAGPSGMGMQRRKLPEIPKLAKLAHRPAIPPEPHYPSSFHSSFDEGDLSLMQLPNAAASSSNPHLSSVPAVPPPHQHQLQHHPGSTTMQMNPVYESYHQQFRQHQQQLHRQHSSPLGMQQQQQTAMLPTPSRQLPMAPFGHRRTASSSNFVHDMTSPGNHIRKLL